jgi:hypothetical protein
MVYFDNAFRWSYFHHNLKMHGPSCKISKKFCLRKRNETNNCAVGRKCVKYNQHKQANVIAHTKLI